MKRVCKEKSRPEDVKREMELLAENDHPFIMYLVKTFETPSSVYMLTELITGGELHTACGADLFSRGQAMFYIGSVFLALEALHERNIVYRDLKPENVMLDVHGYPKLIDFGAAKKLGASGSRTFTIIGTPHYMAPEVILGKCYGAEVDIWAIGVILFVLICGCLPFGHDLEDPLQVSKAVLKGNATFPPEIAICRVQRNMIRGLLTKNVAKRLGCGLNGYEDIKAADFFKTDGVRDIELTSSAYILDNRNFFDLLIGRELEPPVVPRGETYCDSEDIDGTCSDDDVFK